MTSRINKFSSFLDQNFNNNSGKMSQLFLYGPTITRICDGIPIGASCEFVTIGASRNFFFNLINVSKIDWAAGHLFPCIVIFWGDVWWDSNYIHWIKNSLGIFDGILNMCDQLKPTSHPIILFLWPSIFDMILILCKVG